MSILISRVLNVITIATNPTPKLEENEFIALEFADFASVMLLLIALLILFYHVKMMFYNSVYIMPPPRQYTLETQRYLNALYTLKYCDKN